MHSVPREFKIYRFDYINSMNMFMTVALVAQLGERKTEDLKVRGSIPRGGIFYFTNFYFL